MALAYRARNITKPLILLTTETLASTNGDAATHHKQIIRTISVGLTVFKFLYTNRVFVIFISRFHRRQLIKLVLVKILRYVIILIILVQIYHDIPMYIYIYIYLYNLKHRLTSGFRNIPAWETILLSFTNVCYTLIVVH